MNHTNRHIDARRLLHGGVWIKPSALAAVALSAVACGGTAPAETDDDAPTTSSGGSGASTADGGAGAGVLEGGAGGNAPGTGGGGNMECSDDVQNGDETDVDCGGACAPCDNTMSCIDGADCVSGGCDGGVCGAWSATFSTTGNDRIENAVLAANGDIIVAGFIEGAIDLGCGGLASAGGQDIVVARLTPQGACIWSRSFGSFLNDVPTRIAVTASDHVVVSAVFAYSVDFGGGPLTSLGGQDLAVFELDAMGTHVWSKRFGGSGDDYVYNMGLDGSGNVLITGMFRSGSINFGGLPLDNSDPQPQPSFGDVFIVKLTSTGDHVWSKAFGGPAIDGDDSGTVLTVDSSGDVGVGGFFRGTINFGGAGFVSAGLSDFFLVRLDGSNGAHVWSVRYGTSANETLPSSIAFDASGALFVAGHANTGTDLGGGVLPGTILAAKYSATGTHLWSRGFAGNYARAVAVDPSGDVLIAGELLGATVAFDTITLQNAGSQDGFVVRLDGSNGTALAGMRFYSTSQSTSKSGMALNPATGNVLVAGTYSGTIDLGDGQHTSSGNDGYVGSLGPMP